MDGLGAGLMIRSSERSASFCWLDDAVMEIEVGWPALIWNTRHIIEGDP